MTGKRKRYSADFKAKVALEALRGELTAAQPDDGRRVVEAGDGRAGGGVFRPVGGAGNGEVIGGRVEKLHAKIGQLLVERDFLAKAFGR